MRKHPVKRRSAMLFLVACVTLALTQFRAQGADLPDPSMKAPVETGDQTIVLAGGCFWGMQEIFDHVKGVKHTVVGYAGGSADTARYETVSTGSTGHAESVRITYDPAQISFGQLLKVYFAVAHNPTQLNYQGPDHGTQYRSEIFATTPDQMKAAEGYIAQIQSAKAFSDPVVTKVEPLKTFYPAEAHHQNYAKTHPNDMYIMINDDPKVISLQKTFPALYVE